MDRLKYKNTEVIIRDFRELTDEEIENADLAQLPGLDVDPKEYAGRWYLSLAKKYEMTAFLVPQSLVIQLQEIAMRKVKRSVNRAIEDVWF